MLKDGRCVGVGKVGLDRKKNKIKKKWFKPKNIFLAHYKKTWLFANPEHGEFIVIYLRSIPSLQKLKSVSDVLKKTEKGDNSS